MPRKNRGIGFPFFNYEMFCFKHAMLLKLHIQGQLKSLTSRTFFGSYYYSLIKHAPEQHHIVSDRTSNTEKEEATFNSIKVATSLVSSHHLNNIIANALIRLQAKDTLNKNQTTPERELKITKMYGSTKGNFKNTATSFHCIKKYKRQNKCILKSIVDYLTDEGMWWNKVEDGAEFFNVDNIPHNSKLLVISDQKQLRESLLKFQVAGSLLFDKCEVNI